MKRLPAFALAMMFAFAGFGFAGCGGTGASGSHPASKPDPTIPARKLCKSPGIRYLGSTEAGGAVCFTLTPDGRRLLEVDFYSTTSCSDRDSSTLVYGEYEGVLPELGAHGFVRLKIPFYNGQQQVAELLFRGAVRGPAASGLITNKGFCESLKVKWTAHRVSKR